MPPQLIVEHNVETVAWQSAHYQEPHHARRTAKLPGKLERLGVLALPRSAALLDTCCGKGEALDALRDAGFQVLAGADGIEHDGWGSRPGTRFVAADVRRLPFDGGRFDAITNLHALHHLGGPSGVESFLRECDRLLKPGGRLFILDFPASPQIRLLFWLLRHRIGTVTPGLRNFAEIVDEEWSYLGEYLQSWRATSDLLHRGVGSLSVVRWVRGPFLYYLTLEKAGVGAWTEESPVWTEAYHDARERERRRRQMPAKLQRLGVSDLPRDSRILDLCCGTGEALDALYQQGFRHLHGIDFLDSPDLAGDARFAFTRGDVRALPFANDSVDVILNIHSLHHLQTPANVALFLDECYRVLRPGGRLLIVDFPGSPQIHVVFRLFLIRWLHVTRYLRWFGGLVRAEWHFLRGYLARWGDTRRLLHEGRFTVASNRQRFFYYYLDLRKPETLPAGEHR